MQGPTDKAKIKKRTLLLKVNSQKPEEDEIKIAANIVRNGGLVAFPTETVYGLGADALNAEAVCTLFEAKKRPHDNPPIVHVASVVDVSPLVNNVPDLAKKIMRLFWPGPLTLILERSKKVPDVTVAGLDTVAIRMPKHNVALALIRKSRCPIAAPSANLAGKPSPTSAQHVLVDLDGRIDAVLDAGPTSVGVESTVLDLTITPPQILRPGGVPYERIADAIGEVELNPVVIAEKAFTDGQARSPGMKYKHYAPNAEMILVEGAVQAIVPKVKEIASSYIDAGKHVAVLATNETVPFYCEFEVKSLGSRSDLEEVARNLFRLLREFDSEGVEVIVAEGLPLEGLGLAVMNRLRKASANRIVRAC